MSNQSSSSVYSEKKIAAYESLFKESSFAKPQEVYLTITVAHLFGQAYIMEQQGTKEGDPVYSRFVCNLEDITKVYINDNVKSSPLFIQCDTDVKGVIHRKRIIVPCLDNVASIVEQIKEVQALHMEKYEAAQEREKQRKREELEAARKKEQIAHGAKEKLPPLPVVEKLPEMDMEMPVKKPVTVAATPAPKAAPVAPVAEKAPAPKASPVSAAQLNKDLAESLKTLESIEISVSKPAPKAAPVAEAPKPAPVAEKKPEPVMEAPKPAPVAEKKPEPVIEAPKSVPVAEKKPEPVAKPAPKAAPMPMRTNPNGVASSLEDFETAVKKLKSMKDNGVISDEEFAAEKKKLLSSLY